MERGIKKVGVNLISWFSTSQPTQMKGRQGGKERERETHYNIIRSKNKRGGRRRKENIRLCRSHVVFFFRIFGLVWLNWNSLTGKESFSQVKG